MDEAEVKAAAGSTLLVVDDLDENRSLLRRRFAKLGYSIVEAASGPEAIEIVEQEAIDLVILDVSMPGMSGIDVLRTLRASEQSAELPIIMATGHIEASLAAEALALGADHYVSKPIDFKALHALVIAALT